MARLLLASKFPNTRISKDGYQSANKYIQTIILKVDNIPTLYEYPRQPP